LAKNILPFSLFKPELIFLPLVIREKRTKEIKILTGKELMREGYLNASKWFQKAENVWDINKTEKNKNVTLLDCINWQQKLTKQDLDTKYLVLYNASAKDANATLVIRKSLDFEFIVENKTYVFYANEINEAYYLTSILNSSIPNALMKDFQSKGLFGARDVHKKILDVYFPKFDEADKVHSLLAGLGKAAHEKTKLYLETNVPKDDVSGMVLGRLRVDIKKHLAKEMAEIDKLVKKVIG
jgi:hypothetical protein